MPNIEPVTFEKIDEKLIPLVPPGGIGDHFVFTDNLRDAQNNVVGQHSGFCTRVRVIPGADPDLWQCLPTFTLPDGQVTARGVLPIPRPEGHVATLAITGGTEKYNNLRGQVKVTKRAAGNLAEFETMG
jgi:Allene oxide cyclase barrel like domain